MEFIGSATEQNLVKAFAGESQARNRYTFFAKTARKEGYQKIASIFEETAANEEEHAKLFFKQLKGGVVEIVASYPAGVISSTVENLAAAAGGELEEWGELYPEFANIADKEGFHEVAALFRNIAEVEKHHADRYTELLELVKAGKMFDKEAETTWRCRKCGHVNVGNIAPEVCPICAHEQAYFEIVNDKF